MDGKQLFKTNFMFDMKFTNPITILDFDPNKYTE